jgi:hypothetical protein
LNWSSWSVNVFALFLKTSTDFSVACRAWVAAAV